MCNCKLQAKITATVTRGDLEVKKPLCDLGCQKIYKLNELAFTIKKVIWMRKQSTTYSLLYGALIGLVIAGYALGSASAQLLQLDNRFVSVMIRSLVLAVCAGLILLVGLNKKYQFRELINLHLLLFWLFYLFKMYLDYIYYPEMLVLFGQNMFLLALGSTFVPMLTLMIGLDIMGADKIFNIVFAVVFCAAALVAVAGYKNMDVVFGFGVNRFSYDTLNPISVGNVGASLSILALHAIIVRKKSWLNSAVYMVAFVTGMVLATLASSRGPILSLIVASIFLLYSSYRRGELGRSLVVILMILAGSLVVVSDLALRFNFDPLERFELLRNVDADQSSQERITLYENAYNDFIDSPIWGKHVVTSVEKFYPHNIFLEIIMSTGLIGAILVFPAFLMGLVRSTWISSQNSKATWIPSIFIQYLIGSLFSGAIFSNSTFWVFLAATISVHSGLQGRKGKRIIYSSAQYSQSVGRMYSG